MSDVNYSIEQELISIPSDTDGWNLELNKVSWFGKEAKWDLRKWKDDRSKSQKGVTLSEDELIMFLQKAPEIIEKVSGEKLRFEKVTEDTLKSKTQQKLNDGKTETIDLNY